MTESNVGWEDPRINGEHRESRDMKDFDGQSIIRRLEIGGQELLLDDLCLLY